MNSFIILLAIVAIPLVNIDFVKAIDQPYIVTIYNKHTKIGKSSKLCAGSLITNIWVLSTRFCLPRHAYKIRYGDLTSIENWTYSQILNKMYHANSHPHRELQPHNLFKPVVTGSNNIALALIQKVPDQQFGRLTAIDYRSLLGHKVQYCAFNYLPVLKDINKQDMKNNTVIRPENILKLSLNFKRLKKRARLKLNILDMQKNYLRNALKIDQTNNEHDNEKLAYANIKELYFGEGIITPCDKAIRTGPNICVVQKCLDVDTNDSKKVILTPDLGTPLIYDQMIVGISADTDDNILMYTPISPYLNWINDIVKVDREKYPIPPRAKRKRIKLILKDNFKNLNYNQTETEARWLRKFKNNLLKNRNNLSAYKIK